MCQERATAYPASVCVMGRLTACKARMRATARVGHTSSAAEMELTAGGGQSVCLGRPFATGWPTVSMIAMSRTVHSLVQPDSPSALPDESACLAGCPATGPCSPSACGGRSSATARPTVKMEAMRWRAPVTHVLQEWLAASTVRPRWSPGDQRRAFVDSTGAIACLTARTAVTSKTASTAVPGASSPVPRVSQWPARDLSVPLARAASSTSRDATASLIVAMAVTKKDVRVRVYLWVRGQGQLTFTAFVV